MRKLILLVLTVTASVAFASPPVQDEKLPDPVLKLPEVVKEPTVEHTEAEAGPLVQDEADSVLLEPEEEQRVPEETQEETRVMSEETLETEITAIQMDGNIVPAELESETNKTNEKEIAEIQIDPGRESRRPRIGRWSCRGVVLQGKCYQFFRKNLDAYQAEFHCNSICYNGHLASVTNSYIHGEIGKLMDRNGGRTHAWLGGRRILRTKNFRWLDGMPWRYNGWAKGEPNNAGGKENCVETWYNLAFNDVPCTGHKPFICSCPL